MIICLRSFKRVPHIYYSRYFTCFPNYLLISLHNCYFITLFAMSQKSDLSRYSDPISSEPPLDQFVNHPASELPNQEIMNLDPDLFGSQAEPPSSSPLEDE